MNILQPLFGAVIQGQGFPIGAVFYNKTGDILSVRANDKGFGGKTSHITHAEYLAFKELLLKNSIPKELWLCVTYPPCSHCLKEISGVGIKLHVIYLFDPWGKRYKDYIKSLDLKNIGINNELIDKMWVILEKRYAHKHHKLSTKHLLERQRANKILRMAPKKK